VPEQSVFKKMIKNPSVILHSACPFVRFWAGLHSEEARESINYGVDLMTKAAVKILGRAEDTRRVPTLIWAHSGIADADGSGT
jgi:hypothetical protein